MQRSSVRAALGRAAIGSLLLASCGISSDDETSSGGAAGSEPPTIESTTTPPIDTTTWPENSATSWFDHVWEFGPLTETASDSGTVRTVSTDLSVRNPLTDRGYSLPASWVALRSPDGEVFGTKWATNLRDETSDLYFELGPEQRGEWQLYFEVPNDVSLAELTIELGGGTDRRARITPAGTDPQPESNEITLGTTFWRGEYSWNSAELVFVGGFASTSAGTYADGRGRPAPSFNGDRQADEAEAFLHLDFEITEFSTSGVAGINVNTFRILADGQAFDCASDAPGGIEAATAAFSTTCPVPVGADSLTLEIGTDPCVGGCTEWAWSSPIDAAFLTAFK